MALILPPTVGYDSYIDLTGASTVLWGSRYPAWSAADPEDQERALVEATETIETLVEWTLYDPTTDPAPKWLIRATAVLAYRILTGWSLDHLNSPTLIMEKTGPMVEQFVPESRGPLPADVETLVLIHGQYRGGNTVQRLV